MNTPLARAGKKVLTLVLGVTILSSSFFLAPAKAEAQWLTFDASSFVQETIAAVQTTFTAGSTALDAANSSSDVLMKYVIRPLALAAAKAAINAMLESIINWINSGFEGSPAFTTNLNRNLRQLGDGIAGAFVNELLNNTSINSPYIQQVASRALDGYLLYTSRDAIASRLRYNLDETTRDAGAFRRGQFNQGGFNSWMSITIRCGNDPYCAQYATEEGLSRALDNARATRVQELQWGRGYLSWRNCPDTDQADGTDTTVGVTELSDAETTSGCSINTPGSTLENALGFSATSPLRQLELADTFDEIIAALANQLIESIFSEVGLSGAGEGFESGSGGRTDNSEALLAGFRQSVEQERTQTAENQTAWQELSTTINQAVQMCGAQTTTKANQARSAKTQADAMLAKAPNTIAALDDLLADITELQNGDGTNYSIASGQLTSRFNQILQTGRVTAPSPVLKSQMEAIVANSCAAT